MLPNWWWLAASSLVLMQGVGAGCAEGWQPRRDAGPTAEDRATEPEPAEPEERAARAGD